MPDNLLLVLMAGVILMFLIYIREQRNYGKEDVVLLEEDSKPKKLIYPPVEMGTFYLDDVQDFLLMEQQTFWLLGKIKSDKERMFVVVYLEPRINVQTQKKE